MFNDLFKRKKDSQQITLSAPVSGECISLEDVPDPVFSEKMMGDGCAIKPSVEKIVAPVNGKIVQVFPTKHAIGIETENGAQILIHIGLETVELDGEGFTSYVEEGVKVNQGETILQFDMKTIEEKGKSTIVPVIVTNTNNMREIRKNNLQQVTAGQDDILYVKK